MRNVFCAGHWLPSNVADRIDTAAAEFSPDAQIAAVFHEGAVMAFNGRIPALDLPTDRARAFMEGQVYGASLRTLRYLDDGIAAIEAEYSATVSS